ncbi:MAG: triose-phosphate isomerase [Bacteriovoracaceae bacterium]|jgi:triosephosphate isomerase
MKKLIVANWKMNKNAKDCFDFFDTFSAKYSSKREAWVAPQSIHLNLIINLGMKCNTVAGLQNCSEHNNGAFTGEISPVSAKELGAGFVILGHSERREIFKENSKLISAKVKAAHKAGLKVIFCLGETLAEREAGITETVLKDQLHQGLSDQSLATADNLVVAYEPIWAIGTGKTATPAMAQEAHAFIRSILKNKFPGFGETIRLLYGGSVKPDNVEELLAQKDIDGGLVGGASLKPQDFLALCGDK